jgi:DNA-binding NarL/FixJ family response regulator
MVNIALADDSSYLLKALTAKLSLFDDLSVAFTAAHGQQLLDLVKQQVSVDLILMDIEMPVMDGITATALIKENYPRVKIIMLTVFDDDDAIFRAIKAGADGYLLKEVEPQELYQAIIETMKGGAMLSPSIASRTLRLFRDSEVLAQMPNKENYHLTSREVQVLERLSKGIKYEMIAKEMFISKGTVRKHVEHIYEKLQVHNKLEAVHKAKQSGLI